MFYAMANDIVPEEQRATIFLLGSAGSILGDMLAPTLSSFLMMKSPWIPVLGGMSIVILSSGLIFIIPETLYMGAANPHTKSPDPATISTESVKHDDTNIWTAIRSRVFAAWNNVHEFTSMLHSLPTLLLLLTFIVGPFGRVGGDMFLRYVSNRYHWTLAQTGFLLSLQAFFSLFLVVLVLPGASYLLVRRFDFSNKAKDLLLAQFSLLMLTIGALAIAFAPEVQVVIFGLAIWTFGNGYPPIARSLITTQVDPQHVGRLFAAIAMIELICYMGAGPLGAVLYHIGLQKRGAWEGLPYICFAVVNSFAVVCLFIFGYIKRRDWKRGDIRL
jgi:MFS family permease